MDADSKQFFQALIQGQQQTDRALTALTSTIDKYVSGAEVRVGRIEKRLESIEKNLDLLIRAITRDHTNGKGHR